jgi:hypothetical protein
MQWRMVFIVRTGVSDGRFFHDAEGKSYRKHGKNKHKINASSIFHLFLKTPIKP